MNQNQDSPTNLGIDDHYGVHFLSPIFLIESEFPKNEKTNVDSEEDINIDENQYGLHILYPELSIDSKTKNIDIPKTNIDLFLLIEKPEQFTNTDKFIACLRKKLKFRLSKKDNKRFCNFCQIYLDNLCKRWEASNSLNEFKNNNKAWLQSEIQWPDYIHHPSVSAESSIPEWKIIKPRKPLDHLSKTQKRRRLENIKQYALQIVEVIIDSE